MVEAARAEARRLLEALGPFVDRGLPVVGLEPSCLFGLKDEFGSLLPGPETEALGEVAMTFEDFVLREHDAGRWGLDFNAVGARQAYVHGHCHQKAFGAMPALVKTLRLIPELDVQTIESSCCGMAGAFGYHPEHIDVSLAMAEASLLPAVRAAAESALIVADGTSCRHQIEEGAGRKAVHSAQVLAMAAGASG
jgi:Fe-S oxidoreductase